MESKPEVIPVHTGDRPYQIMLGADWVGSIGKLARNATGANRAVVITNPEIRRLYGNALLFSLRNAGLGVDILEIPEGESNKTIAAAQMVWDHLVSEGHTRQSALIALGGGIVGDITGFAAATYMRGIPFVQIPTTLLSMVDASVGGKTGVNHPHAKNMIGAFWQPSLVFVDVAYLRSLPIQEFRAGFSEAVKHGAIRDPAYFDFLSTHLGAIFNLEEKALLKVVRVSCEIKAAVVSQDEREADLRAILNFGHTVGHALEAVGQYGNSRHGEAVAIGMVAACLIAEKMNLCSERLTAFLRDLLERAGLPTVLPDLPIGDILHKLRFDKKVRDGKVRFVLPKEIGKVIIRDDVPEAVIASALEQMRK